MSPVLVRDHAPPVLEYSDLSLLLEAIRMEAQRATRERANSAYRAALYSAAVALDTLRRFL